MFLNFHLIILLVVGTILVTASDELFINNNPFESDAESLEELHDGLFYTKLDHFRPQDYRHIPFKYKVNANHFDENGPLFYYINDAGSYTTEWLTSGLIYDLAVEVNGALLTFDHRFFKSNLPTVNASFENLQYLTVEQSLSDIVKFITITKEHLGARNSKVIVWGSGYGATLALLARQKYPHLINGAWSTSGLFYSISYDAIFYDVLALNIQLIGGPICTNRLTYAFTIIDLYLQLGQLELIQNQLNLCYPVDITSPYDEAMFYEGLINYIARFTDRYHVRGIHDFCRHISASPDTLLSFSRWLRFTFGNSGCFNFNYDSTVELARNEDWNQPGTDSGLRQWYYFKCTQIGLRRITGTFQQIFPTKVTIEYHTQLCEDIFGPEYREYRLYRATYHLNSISGAQNQRVTNSIFTNGLIDPWIGMAVTTTQNVSSQYVVNMQYHSRSADLTSLTGWDSPILTNGKQTVLTAIRQWISED